MSGPVCFGRLQCPMNGACSDIQDAGHHLTSTLRKYCLPTHVTVYTPRPLTQRYTYTNERHEHHWVKAFFPRPPHLFGYICRKCPFVQLWRDSFLMAAAGSRPTSWGTSKSCKFLLRHVNHIIKPTTKTCDSSSSWDDRGVTDPLPVTSLPEKGSK